VGIELTELCRLALKYGTDKAHYTPFYSLLLEGRRLTTRRVLEIGIGTPLAMQHVKDYKTGASLRMWEEYFPNAEIYGMDVDPSTLFSEGRIKTIIANQGVPSQYAAFVEYAGPFDLIVDDGSHIVSDQRVTAEILLPHLAPGGLYIIEDVNGSSDFIPKPHIDVFVKDDLTGHCVVI
jgi:hypothetical protein